jgi:hypothetical protein
MKYTIINSDSGAPFIQQHYDSLEEAQARLEAIKQKASGRPVVIVGVDDTGGFHGLTEQKETETHESDQTNRPIHDSPSKRRRN